MNPFALPLNDTYLWRCDQPAPVDVPLETARGWLAAGVAVHAPVRGSVYGTLLNDRRALQALGDAVHQPPYKAPPQAPVLYIKPRNTLCAHGTRVVVPAGVEGLLAGAALGAVIGTTACRVREQDALACVAGYVIVNDLTVPHDSFYRPALPFRVRDHSCPMGPWIRAARLLPDPDDVTLSVYVDGIRQQQASTAGFIRPLGRLLQDITAFMTLVPGDVLLTGVPAEAPLVRAGQSVAIEIAGLGRLENHLIPESPSFTGNKP
ncbi:fumarylacetoacetate hydrolase family protein [Castellaniella sp.]|uniref:fumarylacetoacetate hydrolase family protein n=1 Tax=Castellaniella sp. TaxID=1955812 RepID=UPI00356A90EF